MTPDWIKAAANHVATECSVDLFDTQHRELCAAWIGYHAAPLLADVQQCRDLLKLQGVLREGEALSAGVERLLERNGELIGLIGRLATQLSLSTLYGDSPVVEEARRVLAENGRRRP